MQMEAGRNMYHPKLRIYYLGYFSSLDTSTEKAHLRTFRIIGMTDTNMNPDPSSSLASFLTNPSIPQLLKRHQALNEIQQTIGLYIASDTLYAVSTLLKLNFAEYLGLPNALANLGSRCPIRPSVRIEG